MKKFKILLPLLLFSTIMIANQPPGGKGHKGKGPHNGRPHCGKCKPCHVPIDGFIIIGVLAGVAIYLNKKK